MIRMDKGKEVENLAEEHEPDCSTCWKRKSCERYAENTYCTQWQSQEPEKRKPDPNEAWMRGDPAEF